MKSFRTSRQRGGSTFLVLIVLTTMLLGGLALARITDAGTLQAGNIASREAALQASEIGINDGYAAVRALKNVDADLDQWYRSKLQATEAGSELPAVTWADVPSETVGPYKVQYVAERVCDTGAVTDPYRSCLLKEIDMPANRSEDPNNRELQLDNPYAQQFRITARTTDARDTTVLVQALVTKGND